MPRPVKNLRTIRKNLSLDEDLVAKMELELYSEVDQRVPVGAQSLLVNKLLRKYFRNKEKQLELMERTKDGREQLEQEFASVEAG